MNHKLTSLIRKIGLPTLQQLIGNVILKAIKSINKGEDEEAIAEILILKYGTLIFQNKDIRAAVIDSLSLKEAVKFCQAINLPIESERSAYKKLVTFFEIGYSSEKSKQFVDFFQLGQEYYTYSFYDTRTEKEIINAVFAEEVKILSYLHPYQKRIKDEIMLRLNQKIERTFFVQMPTGAGKTYTALECVVDLMRKPRNFDDNNRPVKEKYIVWLVDRNELAEQAFQSFKKLWKIRGDHPISTFRYFKDFEPNFLSEDGGVVFAGFDKFRAVLQSEDKVSISHLIQNTELLIVDEAHHSLAATYLACINEFRPVPYIKLMGLSATPGAADIETTRGLVELYSGDKISVRDGNWQPVSDAIAYLQNEGYLAKLRSKLLETGITTNDRNENRVLDDLASNSDRNRKIIEQIELANNNNESTVVFACTLDHVYALLILCRALNIMAKYIVGDIDQAERITILEGFKAKQFNILINLDILSTGIDLPNIDKVIIARPINSPNLISQILGRALRGPKNGGNEFNTIINIKDNLLNFPGTSFLYNYYQGDWERLN